LHRAANQTDYAAIMKRKQ